MGQEGSQSIAARLYVEAPLTAGAEVQLDSSQSHYLANVLRLHAGAAVGVFNGRDGEWLGLVRPHGKRSLVLSLERQTRPQVSEPDLWLLFAPVKRARIDYIAEKATELGVSVLMPVITARTIATRVNTDRLRANAREAAEQTERLTVPAIADERPLARVLEELPAARRLIVCDETGRAPPIADVLAATTQGPAAILIGPEGGFAPEELDAILKLPSATRVSLGPRVLRADTAALAAVAVYQALAGDWRRARDPD